MIDDRSSLICIHLRNNTHNTGFTNKPKLWEPSLTLTVRKVEGHWVECTITSNNEALWSSVENAKLTCDLH